MAGGISNFDAGIQYLFTTGIYMMVFPVIRYFRLLPWHSVFGNNGNYRITVYQYSEIPVIIGILIITPT